FLARHPELANRVAHRISRECVNVSARDIEEWAEELKKVCKEYEIKQADQFWNFDEKRFMLGVAQKTQVVVRRGEAGRDATFIQDGNREWITVVESVNAAGNAAGDTANPMIIFAGNNLMESWVEDPIKNAHYCVSPSGWTDDKKRLDWLKIWEEETRQDDGKWRLLLMDGHGSHLTIDFLQYALDHHVLPFCLIPHTTHLVQPLDVALFSSLQHNYSKALDQMV
ncbi:DDE-domain-containing protein, partial [Atractiella rhizophila]